MSPSPVPARLLGIRAKIERAEHHIRDLESRIDAFRETNPYGVLCEQGAHADERVFRVHVRTPPPLDIPVIAGEAIHQLRSSLDHLAWQLVEANGRREPGRHTSFPLHETAAEYMAHAPRKVKGINSRAVRLIKAVQPYRRGYDALRVLGELDNIDKHRLLIVIGYGMGEFTVHHTRANTRASGRQTRSKSPLPLSIVVLPPSQNGAFPMAQNGDQIVRLRWSGITPPEVNKEFDCAFDIAFAQPQVVEGQPVLACLTKFLQLVDGVVNQFVPFL